MSSYQSDSDWHSLGGAARIRRPLRRLMCGLAIGIALVGCQEPFSWPRLLASKIAYEYPSYRVEELPDGKLVVHRPGLTDVTVDTEPIGRFCQRGPKDCSYATDQMLLGLRAP